MISYEDRKPDMEMLYLFNEGKYFNASETFGARPCTNEGMEGVRFTLWAPDVKSVSVIGDFNDWDENRNFLSPVESTGVWTAFVPGALPGQRYKYFLVTEKGEKLYKADPFAFLSEKRPDTASVIWDMSYEWGDEKYIYKRNISDHFEKPMNIYELHAGSWKRKSNADGDYLSYRELADLLIPYVKDMGYTHIELLPLMEHPFDGSWGYQITGFYSATSRYGKPEDLKYLVDKAHRAGIGVIFDWVPGHFCKDAQGLYRFNGSDLFEIEEHPNWGTMKFDFGRNQVRSFLFSNAVFWLKEYHGDGLRIDGVSSMLYLNFGFDENAPKRLNKYGDDRNLEAVSFLQELAENLWKFCPGTFTVAEESSSWPMVTKPPKDGGLGFHYKWDMGWMNDSLRYFETDYPGRSSVHSLLTFSMMYAFNENFILPLSHDEVVHGKRSLIGKMPGDSWRQFANLRLLLLYQMTHPGAKLTFMGYEFGQYIEWREYEELEWFLIDRFDSHRKQQIYTRDLNRYYLSDKALFSDDRSWDGFVWEDADNNSQSVYIYQRISKSRRLTDIVVLNLGIDEYMEYRIGVPKMGIYKEVFSSDRSEYGGNGIVNGDVLSEDIPYQGQPYSVVVKLPALSGLILRRISSKSSTDSLEK